MEIVTPFGVKWIKASYPQLLIIAGFFLLLLAFIVLLKYYQFLKNKKIQDESLLLFRMKRLGLSNFQIKLINNLVRTLKLNKPNDLLDSPELFELAIGRFLQFLRTRNEDTESLSAMCKDITITYEKLYNPSHYKKPLESISQIENNQLLYFTTADGNIYLGKIITKNLRHISLKLFRNQKELHHLGENQLIMVYIWRIGDAEYIFQSYTQWIDKSILTISLPEKFTRDKEFRHPYIDTIIPFKIIKTNPGPLEEDQEFKGTLLKINDYEAVIRMGNKLDYDSRYTIDFEAMEFHFTIISKILANKTIEEGNIFYFTLKFEEMSEAAQNILKRYIYEHL